MSDAGTRCACKCHERGYMECNGCAPLHAPVAETRTERIRREQRSGTDKVTAVMVSRAACDCGYEIGDREVHAINCASLAHAPVADGCCPACGGLDGTHTLRSCTQKPVAERCEECGETVAAGDAHQHSDREREPIADGGEILADRDETEIIYGAPSLRDARVYLAQHDAALRAEVEDQKQKVATLLSALRGEQGIVLDDGTELHPCAERDQARAEVERLKRENELTSHDRTLFAGQRDNYKAALVTATRALREVRALDFTESNRISDSALAQIEGVRK